MLLKALYQENEYDYFSNQATLTYNGNVPLTVNDNVTITDVFNPVLSDLTVAFNGVTWTEETNYVYNETTGEFETLLGQVTVPTATYIQDSATGGWIIEPGVSVLTVTGTV